jgi:hypothetical protein
VPAYRIGGRSSASSAYIAENAALRGEVANARKTFEALLANPVSPPRLRAGCSRRSRNWKLATDPRPVPTPRFAAFFGSALTPTRLGTSPLACFQDLRIQRAVHLGTSHASVDRIATEVGYGEGVTSASAAAPQARSRRARNPPQPVADKVRGAEVVACGAPNQCGPMPRIAGPVVNT